MANPDELREAALDTEGMQTIRTLADNVAWMLARFTLATIPTIHSVKVSVR